MRKLMLMFFVIGMSCPSWAQSSGASWESLNTLHAGDKIQVTEMNSKVVSGKFVSYSDTAISLQARAGQQTIQKQDVGTVKLAKNNKRLRNTAIGAGIGAGAGAGIGAGAWESRGFLGGKGVGAAVGAVIGALAGAVVGALVPNHQTVYRAATH
jgi:outer membrane lipoprotein SlyB